MKPFFSLLAIVSLGLPAWHTVAAEEGIRDGKERRAKQMSVEERASKAFAMIDSDGSGELSLSELKAFRESTKDRREAKREEHKEKRQARREANGGEVNEERQAKRQAKRAEKKANRPSPEERFAQADTDQSGGLSMAEFQAVVAKRLAKRIEMKEKRQARRSER